MLAAAAWTAPTTATSRKRDTSRGSALRDGIPTDSWAPAIAHQIVIVTWFVGGDIPAALEGTRRGVAAVDAAGVDDPFGLALLATTRYAFEVMSSNPVDLDETAAGALELAVGRAHRR